MLKSLHGLEHVHTRLGQSVRPGPQRQKSFVVWCCYGLVSVSTCSSGHDMSVRMVARNKIHGSFQGSPKTGTTLVVSRSRMISLRGYPFDVPVARSPIESPTSDQAHKGQPETKSPVLSGVGVVLVSRLNAPLTGFQGSLPENGYNIQRLGWPGKKVRRCTVCVEVEGGYNLHDLQRPAVIAQT